MDPSADGASGAGTAAEGQAIGAGPAVWLGVFLASVATLHLEILQTRIFSVLLWHHVTYLVVTFTLLGFAASGTLLAIFPRLVTSDPPRFLAVCSLLFAVTTQVAFQILGRSELDTIELLEDPVQYVVVFAYYLYLVVPYIFAGLVIVGALRTAGRRTAVTYGVNLGGSAFGCLLFATTLRPLGGEGAVLLGSALAALAALAFACAGRGGAPARWRLPLGALSALVTAGCLLALPVAPDVLPFREAPSKLMRWTMDLAREAGKQVEVVETVWDPLCRIDVVDVGEPSKYMVYQDADAPTTILGADYPHDPGSIYGLAYLLSAPEPDVLVIGVGGGHDLRYALWSDAASVTGVEINRSTAALVRGPFADYAGDVYSAPGVEVIETEGRSFVRRADQVYDLIQMTGTDTYTALASGSYVMSESYLYTVEAFEDYFAHLAPDGMLAIVRFRFFPPRESLRLLSIAVEALRRRGVEHPERHILAVDRVQYSPSPMDPSQTVKIAYTAMLFRPEPFTNAQIAKAERFVERRRGPFEYSLAYAPGVGGDPNFEAYLAAVAAGEDEAFAAAYPYRVDPVFDDAPFFFNFHRWDRIFGDGADGAEGATQDSDWAYFAAIGEDPVGLYLLLTAFVESLLLVAALVVLPLLVARRIQMPRSHRLSVLTTFLGLGIGYLFLEIAFMQQLVLYLGHPTRSITVVLFSFLLFSGLGALLVDRLRGPRVGARALVVVLVLISLYALALPLVLERTLGLSTNARILLTVALLAPPAFFMGMPFPSALARLRGANAPFLPWAFAINGGASVLASVAAIFAAMGGGFSLVLWLAAASYLLALLGQRGLPDAPVD